MIHTPDLTIAQNGNLMNIDPSHIINSIDQYVFCKNTEGIYLYGNKSFSLIAGVDSNDTIIGKTDYDLIWKSQANRIKEKDEGIFKGKSILRKRENQVRREGISQIIISRKPYRLDNKKEILGIVGNFFDINEHLFLETKGEFDERRNRLHLGFTPESLSASEIRVCFYLIQGFPANRIAQKASIKVSTVRYHINNIKEKMQCNANEITEILMQTGIAWKILTLQHNMGNTDEL